MSASFFWTLPVEGDRRGPSARRSFLGDVRDERRDRFTEYDYLLQVARAAESSGFTGAFVPWSARGDDSWIVAASLVREVRRLIFLPELQPGFTTPVYLAKISVSFQRLSRGRLAWKIDLERDPVVRRAHGDVLEGADWFTRAGEYLEAAKGVWGTEPFDFTGRHFSVEKGGLKGPLAGRPRPLTYTAGRSDEALAFAAKHADVHILEGNEPAAVRSEIARLDHAVARGAGSVNGPIKRGIRLAVVTRHTDEEALDAARAVGWESRADAIIGSHDAVARRIDELVALGIEHFVLDGAPHLEFLDVLKGVWKQAPFDYNGRFYQIEGGGLPPQLAEQEIPQVYFSGSSNAAIDAAGRHADYYLSHLEPFDSLKEKLERVRERSAAEGRRAKFALRFDILARRTPEEAWAEVARAWRHVDRKTVERMYAGTGDSVGFARQRALRPSAGSMLSHRDMDVDQHIAPGLWGGFHLFRGGPGIGVVGSYEQAAAWLDRHINAGIDAFVLAGTPHLEEAYRVGEEVLPLVRARVRDRIARAPTSDQPSIAVERSNDRQAPPNRP